jgi:hypothetical protein
LQHEDVGLEPVELAREQREAVGETVEVGCLRVLVVEAVKDVVVDDGDGRALVGGLCPPE